MHLSWGLCVFSSSSFHIISAFTAYLLLMYFFWLSAAHFFICRSLPLLNCRHFWSCSAFLLMETFWAVPACLPRQPTDAAYVVTAIVVNHFPYFYSFSQWGKFLLRVMFSCISALLSCSTDTRLHWACGVCQALKWCHGKFHPGRQIEPGGTSRGLSLMLLVNEAAEGDPRVGINKKNTRWQRREQEHQNKL